VTNDASQNLSADLAKVVRGDVFADIIHRAAYSSDASIYRIVPQCVVAPRDRADIIAVVKYAHAKGVPVVARGAASGVAGESLGSGIVFDMRRYMNRIIRVDDDGATVVCEPGVVLDDMNRRLAEYGRKIGPDPSTSNRAVVGGCVANNATGAHSLEFGYIGDYVESVEMVLADGGVAEFRNDFDPADAENESAVSIAKKCLSVLLGNEQVISRALPRSKRNRSGYTIAGICHNGRIDLAKLMAGSEGTLGIFTKITIRTVPVPAEKALLQLEFDCLGEMAEAAAIVVDSGASACELMDKKLINMALEAVPGYHDILPGGAAAVLLVEHTGQTQGQVREKIESTVSAVGKKAVGKRVVFDSKMQKRLWKVRKDAVPLLYRQKSRKRPVPFVEDVAVGNERLAEYISRLEEIAKRHEISMSFYGHAGDGELHIRPYLDLAEKGDVAKMLAIANDVFSLAWSLGGTISGEHADGLVRAAFLRRQYGDEFYELLCKIKNIFDPDGLMNPGKIINSDADVMVSNLRAQRKVLEGRVFEKTNLLFEKDEIALELEQCNGCGLCLSSDSALRMCPVFRAAGEELASSRAKANVIGFWAGGQMGQEQFESQEFSKFLDLCVNCKACLLQCPSGVDISKLVIAARTEYVRGKGLTSAQLLLSRNRYLGMLGSIVSGVSNRLMGSAIFKWFLEEAVGLDRKRVIPRFEQGSFLRAGRRYLAKQEPIKEPTDKVAYFVDTYANYNDHELAFAVVGVLRHNNIEVVLPKQRPAPLPAICYGDVKTARRDLAYNVKYLAQAVREGCRIVCSEPSAVVCLKQELRHFVAGEDAKLVSENTCELTSYLLELFRQGKLKEAVNSAPDNEFVYHCPCHLLAVGGGGASIEILEKLCGIKIADLEAGCCGLAGTFGMQKKNYELSTQIADRLKEVLEKASTKNVLTECSACKMQIEHISDCSVSHPIKILAQAYGLLTLQK